MADPCHDCCALFGCAVVVGTGFADMVGFGLETPCTLDSWVVETLDEEEAFYGKLLVQRTSVPTWARTGPTLPKKNMNLVSTTA